MSFLESDAEDLQNMLEEFGEDILYNSSEIKAIVDYQLDNEDVSRGQKTVAKITIASASVIEPKKEDAVILPNASAYTVEKILSGDKNSWTLQLRTNIRAKIGGQR